MVRVADILASARRIYVDSGPWIYFIQSSPDRAAKVAPFLRAITEGSKDGTCSTITLLEILIHPARSGRQDLVEQYTALLTKQPHLSMHPVDVSVAREAARLRAHYDVRTPDALHLATARVHGADLFLTNDRRLKRCIELQVVTIDELVL